MSSSPSAIPECPEDHPASPVPHMDPQVCVPKAPSFIPALAVLPELGFPLTVPFPHCVTSQGPGEQEQMGLCWDSSGERKYANLIQSGYPSRKYFPCLSFAVSMGEP